LSKTSTGRGNCQLKLIVAPIGVKGDRNVLQVAHDRNDFSSKENVNNNKTCFVGVRMDNLVECFYIQVTFSLLIVYSCHELGVED
jgi:hypothetical protein